VRELAGILENALLQADNGVIRTSDLALPDGLQQSPFPSFDQALAASPAVNPWANSSAGPAPMLDSQSSARAADLSLDAIIRHHVQFVLDLNRGNKLRAARQLAISRSTLYRILANENFLAR
jgi:DNA-binding NtrC family response regulator